MFNLKKTTKFLKASCSLPESLGTKLNSLRKDDGGIAAVEFAILSPVLIAIYLGLVEISMIIHADKLTSHATNVAGDLATQVSNMDADDMEDVFEASLATMSLKPNQIGDVGMEIISYNMLPNGTPQELGRATLNGGYTGAAYNPVDIAPRLLSVTSGAVVARVQYDYESVSYKFVEEFTTLDETFILQPRSSADIPFSLDGTPRTYTCTASSTASVTC